jgi:hypothetical protein
MICPDASAFTDTFSAFGAEVDLNERMPGNHKLKIGSLTVKHRDVSH